jgi:hypothetical protein
MRELASKGVVLFVALLWLAFYMAGWPAWSIAGMTTSESKSNS